MGQIGGDGSKGSGRNKSRLCETSGCIGRVIGIFVLGISGSVQGTGGCGVSPKAMSTMFGPCSISSDQLLISGWAFYPSKDLDSDMSRLVAAWREGKLQKRSKPYRNTTSTSKGRGISS